MDPGHIREMAVPKTFLVRHWPRYLAVTLGILGLPIIGIGIAAAVIDPNDYKLEIASAVLAATGRELTMGGELRVGASLWPTIEISDVKLANLRGGSRPDMALVEKIQARLSLSSLLWRRVEVTRLTLVGPNILFELVGGKPNWVFTPATHPGSPQSMPSRMPVSLQIRDFRVRNGMVTSRMPARTNVLGIRSLSLQHQSDVGPLELAATFVYSDLRPFTLTASAQPTGSLTDPWNAKLEFAAFDAAASATGTVSVAGEYDLHLDATLPALEKLNAVVPDIILPALHQATLSTHLTNGPVRGDLPVVGTTQLHVGSVDLDNMVSGLKLGAIDVTLPDAGGLATVKGLGNYAGQTLSLGGTLGVPEHPDGRVSLPVNVTVETRSAPSAAVRGSLSVKGDLTLNTGSFEGFDAAVQLRTPALADLRPFASPAVPELTDVLLSGKLAMPADANSLVLTGAKLTSREGDLAGDVKIGIGKAVALTGKVRSTKLDLDRLLRAFDVDSHSNTQPIRDSTGSLISAAPLPWPALRGPKIDLTIDVGTVTFRSQALHGLEMAMTVKDNRLNVGRLKLGLPAGTLQASLTADASTDVPPLSMTLHAPGIPLSLISYFAGLPDEASGSLQVDAQLRSTGRSPHEMAASLNGSLNATIIGGKMTNAALIALASPVLQPLNIAVPVQGETEIRCAGVVGSFNNGVGRFGTIAVSSTYLEMAGSGQFDLDAETATLKLQPMAQITGSPVSVPVVVEGPLRALQARLDASGLDMVGLFMNGLFGGDKPGTCSDAGLAAAQPKVK
jgi:uncharacterized protein involved in outer membrane biogenesis